MADEPTTSGWQPPRAPGAGPPPRFDRAPDPPAPALEPPAPAAEPPAPAPEPDPPTHSGWAPPARQGWAPPAPSRDVPPHEPAHARSGQTRPVPANTLAIAALVLGIVGLVLLVLSLGLGFLFSVPCSIAAWVCGATARTRIRAGQAEGGRGQAQAGLWLGIAGVVLGVLAMIGWIVAIALGFSLTDFQDDLNRELERQRNPNEVQAVLVAAKAYAATLFRG